MCEPSGCDHRRLGSRPGPVGPDTSEAPRREEKWVRSAPRPWNSPRHPSILDRAGRYFSQVEVVSRRPDGSVHRTTYEEVVRRARALASALVDLGVRPGDHIASLCWNHREHLECYLGVPASGAVLHTLNLRLHPQELAYVVNHAQDRMLVVDDVLLPLFEAFRDHRSPSPRGCPRSGQGGAAPATATGAVEAGAGFAGGPGRFRASGGPAKAVLRERYRTWRWPEEA